jgi:hypothetical protein
VAAETNTDLYVEVDRALGVWRQGDCVLGELSFVHRLDPSLAVTDAGRAVQETGADLVEAEVAGLVIVTQSCDIVRSCTERPYVEVCPLVEVAPDAMREIERGRRPAYAFLPLVAERGLVADLDRVMTVEKPVVAKWRRIAGLSSDVEARAFALALARKRVRFAFPDDFTALAKNLQSRLVNKHDKDSVEGCALRALREIRVQAAPSWNDNSVTLTFWFVRSDEDIDFDGKSWFTFVDRWLGLIPQAGRFNKVFGQVTTLEDLTAADYVNSDPLDLDHLSTRGGAVQKEVEA